MLYPHPLVSSNISCLCICIKKNQTILQEMNTFQNRLNRSMQDCQDQIRDHIQPGDETNATKIMQAETMLVKCMSQTVDHHIQLLKPMRERIIMQLKKL
jgi:hypothetical protein